MVSGDGSIELWRPHDSLHCCQSFFAGTKTTKNNHNNLKQIAHVALIASSI